MATAEAQREYQRQWVARRRAAWFADKRCADCGSPDGLEIHHLDPATKVANAIWSWSRERRDAELAKCIVLCRDCHVDRHRWPHGTRSRYTNQGCRCDACTEAARAYWREQNAKRRQ